VDVTLAQLRAIASHAPAEALTPLNAAMAGAEITTPLRQAAFIAQVAHESNQFRELVEHWGPTADQLAYEGSIRLGNSQPGDGRRFLGRGAIQLTGRANYVRASVALGIDLVNHPERAADLDVAYRTAAWYWTDHCLNKLADDGDFLGITRAINGGVNGLDQRERFYGLALKALGAVAVCGRGT
jgi:predicted chitinase